MTLDRVQDSDSAAPESALRVGRWPVGVLIVAVLRIIDAVSMAAIGLGVKGLPVDALPILENSPILTQSIDIVIAAATIIGVFGLLAFRRWGWVLTMILVGLGLLGRADPRRDRPARSPRPAAAGRQRVLPQPAVGPGDGR